MISVMFLLLLASFAAGAQTPRGGVLPPKTPIPGAPTAECEFPSIDPSTPIRITIGDGLIPYQFACGHNRSDGVCAINAFLPAGSSAWE